jgi:hypothetical protein
MSCAVECGSESANLSDLRGVPMSALRLALRSVLLDAMTDHSGPDLESTPSSIDTTWSTYRGTNSGCGSKGLLRLCTHQRTNAVLFCRFASVNRRSHTSLLVRLPLNRTTRSSATPPASAVGTRDCTSDTASPAPRTRHAASPDRCAARRSSRPRCVQSLHHHQVFQDSRRPSANFSVLPRVS